MAEGRAQVTGGCLCGAVRYEADEQPFDAAYCHCRTCQKARGNPFGISAFFHRDRVRFTRGSPKAFKSSAFAERCFCPECGTHLTFRYTTPGPYADMIAFSIGTLDDPEIIAPKTHWGIEEKLSWVTIDDDAKRIRLDESPEVAAHRAAAEDDGG